MCFFCFLVFGFFTIFTSNLIRKYRIHFFRTKKSSKLPAVIFKVSRRTLFFFFPNLEMFKNYIKSRKKWYLMS